MKMLDNKDLKDLCQSSETLKNVVIIDIREADEHAREHIGGSENLPLSQWESVDVNQYKDKVILVHCRSGNRTKQAETLLSQLACKELFCIDGGIDQWKSCGLTTKVNKKAPIELMRQVQMIVGSMVLLGVILAYFISPLFILVSAFFGAGLLFAGITGWCGMAKVLMLLPYNKQ